MKTKHGGLRGLWRWKLSDESVAADQCVSEITLQSLLRIRKSCRLLMLATLMAAPLLAPSVCRADEGGASNGSGASLSPVADYFAHWFDRVTKSQAEQPHWMNPLVTGTPLLEEEFRYDQFWQSRQQDRTFNNFGGGKGLELIPTENTEIIIGVPAYLERSGSNAANGWADENFLLKYRLLSANEDNGNYILSLFLGTTVPDGSAAFTTHQTVFTPAVALGKGWGDFDFQSTFSIAVPDGQRDTLGTPLSANTVLQYHVAQACWPEFEVNYTYWPNGTRDGINQVYLTPGLMLGNFPVWGRLGLTIGAGFQIAVTPNATFHNNAILSARLPF